MKDALRPIRPNRLAGTGSGIERKLVPIDQFHHELVGAVEADVVHPGKVGHGAQELRLVSVELVKLDGANKSVAVVEEQNGFVQRHLYRNEVHAAVANDH